METISKVKNVQGAGTWDSQYGTLFSFEYHFEDGTVLKANHKTDNGYFKVGEEVAYTVTKDHPDYGKSGKVKKPEAQNNGFKPKNMGKGSQASFALAYAKDYAGFHIEKGVDYTSDQILETATKFNEWLKTNA